jgi:hypothetical protein
MRQIIVIFLEILLGFVGYKCGIITDRDSKFLSNLIMKLLLPCTILASATVEGGQQALIWMLEAMVLMEILYIVTTWICLLIGRMRNYTAGQKAVLVGTGAMPNCGFIGLPLATSVVGSEMGTLYATAAMTSYNLWFFTFVDHMFRPGEKMNVKSLITPTNVSMIAMLIMLATGWSLPTPVQSACSAVGGCTTPLALLVVGVMLAQSDIKALFIKPMLYLITVLRGVVFPLAFMLVLSLLPLDRTLCLALATIASCPAGSLAAVLAKQNGLEEELAGQAVAQSTLFMLVTVPLMLTIASHLFPV